MRLVIKFRQLSVQYLHIWWSSHHVECIWKKRDIKEIIKWSCSSVEKIVYLLWWNLLIVIYRCAIAWLQHSFSPPGKVHRLQQMHTFGWQNRRLNCHRTKSINKHRYVNQTYSSGAENEEGNAYQIHLIGLNSIWYTFHVQIIWIIPCISNSYFLVLFQVIDRRAEADQQ